MLYSITDAVKGVLYIEYKVSVLSYDLEPPTPSPQPSVGELYIQGVERQRGGSHFAWEVRGGGPKSYETLVIYRIYSLYA
jgi:hypothetical protein